MKNIEKYKNDIMTGNDGSIACSVHRLKGNDECNGIKCSNCNREAFKWLLSEAKEPILDDVERKYLQAIIKPFKNYVTGIAKIKDDYMTGKHYIRIIVKKDTQEYINMPWFEGNTMYKGMKVNKYYTLDELGL